MTHANQAGNLVGWQSTFYVISEALNHTQTKRSRTLDEATHESKKRVTC